MLADGRVAMELIQKRLEGRKVQFLNDFSREDAMLYLSSGNRLALIPSMMENYPNTVLECAANGIPFLASRVGGIPEIVSETELNERLLFEPTATDLRRSLTDWLALAPSERKDLSKRMRLHLSGKPTTARSQTLIADV